MDVLMMIVLVSTEEREESGCKLDSEKRCGLVVV